MTETNPPPKKKLKFWQISLIVIGVLVLIGQFSGGSSGDSTTNSNSGKTSASSALEVDFVTKRACRIWRQVISEGSKGVQSYEELRAGMKEVYDVAKVSYDADIVDAATRQLAAITSGDNEAFKKAGNDFGLACESKGQ